ncbi:Holliday junction DNA helicase RuvA [Paucilactobacillus oligofermentans DSM 15707 = LMG 22743]|uniref:Holliday junction branch migration complex subunit RuvA n=1 Tax=Paucilactobacillus oligofermentans DSM 15707 = LMG 22743 TaxID=1423778 RepID=A0A0R1RMC8_9LACO|nr:Holliday junction branch migration protein RuvA [Paucilactobacillus oligofermentans]KRL57964.1 Holliday junction DNA helicase RuvA [Paucilactobacillus oligofermentans DSM 15707 = LMG 22743]CUS26564.1 Holliday junction DNA helicase RuvA [Paucilactobacillus oligofermentans DSM 15707 = LMG 22743]
MYEYLEGKVTIVTPSYIVIDVQGVGYRVLTANPYRYHENDVARIYIYQAVRETELTLYGFVDSDEKQLFEQLLNVSGIGPKSALAILASADHSGLINAIANDDASYLTKFPGVGKKTAGQIVLDLKDKILQLDTGNQNSKEIMTASNDILPLSDALSALESLGYRTKDVEKIAKKLRELPETTTDDYLRQGLTLLTK